MTPQAAGHQQLLRDIKRMAWVRLLCLRPGLWRADLARGLGVGAGLIVGDRWLTGRAAPS